jgi:hypothetical protein
MIVTPYEHGLDIAPEHTDAERSPGLHMSDIYNDLYQDLEPKRFIRGSKPAPALLAVGIALEQYTERLLLKHGIQAERPPEFRTPDQYGIAFSPDLLIYNGGVKGGEIKATFMSSREWPTEQARALPQKADKYVTQTKSYGHNLEIPDWILFVWFLKGKWEKSKSDQVVLADFRAFHLTYMAGEMQREYRMLINHAKHKGML